MKESKKKMYYVNIKHSAICLCAIVLGTILSSHKYKMITNAYNNTNKLAIIIIIYTNM